MIPPEVPLDDEELVTRAQAGDLEAYELLVARHTASAYRTANLSEDETVAMLGWARGTVKSRTSRALVKLRGLLDVEELSRG
ncbi:hypothetical protein [Micromonospora sp. NPDC003816]|uniref:hypothetical protein n=1 Tax=Micromonospora sp. NPDC003816 TaxID=3364224 RepID=UPI003696350C